MKTTPITNDAAKELRYKALYGNKAARDQLWVAAYATVSMVAGRLRRDGLLTSVALDDEDLIQEGILAAGRALDKWDPEKGAFSTWVTHRAAGAMLTYAAKVAKGGLTGRHERAVLVDVDEAVGEEEGYSDGDRPGETQGAAYTLGDTLAEDEDPEIAESQKIKDVAGLIGLLEDGEAYRAVCLYFGMNSKRGAQHTFQEIADVMGLGSREAARRLVQDAIDTIRVRSRSKVVQLRRK